MKVTSAQANKLLRKLHDDLYAETKREDMSKNFVVSLGEDVESVRPEYDFTQTQNQIDEIQRKIRVLKHAINIFNTTTVIEEFGITIDEILVLIPQLSNAKTRLEHMKDLLPKMRESSGYSRSSSVVEYRYLNYDLAVVKAKYEEVCDKLAKAQTALDVANNSLVFEVEL